MHSMRDNWLVFVFRCVFSPVPHISIQSLWDLGSIRASRWDCRAAKYLGRQKCQLTAHQCQYRQKSDACFSPTAVIEDAKDFYLMYLILSRLKSTQVGIIITKRDLYTRFIPADMSLLPI